MTFLRFKKLLGLFLFFLTVSANARSKDVIIQWETVAGAFPGKFSEAQSDHFSDGQYFPVWVWSELTGSTKFSAAVSNAEYEPVIVPGKYVKELMEMTVLQFVNAEERGVNRFKVRIVPFRVTGGRVERLVRFTLVLTETGSIEKKLGKKGNKSNSVLGTGTWYKMRIREDAVYRIDRAFLLKNGINPDGIDLSTFKVYGNGGGMLPEPIVADRPDDLLENSIKVKDQNNNNRLDDGDEILFFGKGPDHWQDRVSDYVHVKNVYSDYACYFITWGGTPGKRISENGAGTGVTPVKTITESDYLMVHEEDLINFRNSGREWFGEALTVENKSFDITLPDLIPSSGNFIRSEIAVRTAIPTSVNLSLNGGFFINHFCGSVNFDSDDDYADVSNQKAFFNGTGPLNLTYEFIRPQLSSEAWLNYFEIQCRRKMKPLNGQVALFNLESKISNPVKFQVEDLTTDYELWDVTDPVSPQVQLTFDDNGKKSFIVNPGGKLLRFQVWKNGSGLQPEMIGKLENQDLHALTPADYIIITHPDFKEQAEKLAEFHETTEGYTYLIAYPEKIYNEFSSGVLDVTAIRDFLKMLYDRAPSGKKPRAVLLFGDASFDYKDRIQNNGNFVPTFESYEYNNSVLSYCSDDYFAMLGDNEGNWPVSLVDENIDVAISRLPAKSVYEAEVFVDKCITYKKSSLRGEWRSSITFLGDDEDSDVHMTDSEKLSDLVESEFKPFNINKIYLDAYKQVSLGNGNAYPDVNEAINNSITRGTLIFNYLGHGGGSGMAHERVVTRPQILGWKNYDRLSFFVTGTCDLAQYDNPKEESPGELMMINDQGGAIGMMTTTRKVYIGLNTSFSMYLFKNNLMKRTASGYTTIGDAYANVKNAMWQSSNVRNYVIFGDPLLQLNLPVQKTEITKINGNPVTTSSHDTLKALSKVEIEGIVTDLNGNLLNDFNGDVSVTLFDKKQTYKTLANDPSSSVIPFAVRNNVLYRGKASVTSGAFKVSFIMPKDIDYSIGTGRIFTYAYSETSDGVGIYDSALVGGTASAVQSDIEGPQIEVFMEDDRFINGGIVSKNPVLLVKLWDENGINTAGTGVGREILGTLDKNTETAKTYVLNDFYSTTVNSYQGGEVRFPLSDLSPGKHTLTVRAWDVYNNSSESQVEFLVAENEKLVIRNLLNYPNPFVNRTTFHFDHNKSGQDLTVSIQILSVSGKLIKTLSKTISAASSHISELEWDGRDDYGDNLGRGVYIYKVKIRSEDGKTGEEIQKLVLLK